MHRKVQQTHTPPHSWVMVASVCGLWPQCGELETTQAVTLKSGSSMTLLQFLNLPGFGGNCIRSLAISAWGCGQGVLACLLGCLQKKIWETPDFSQQPVMDTATPLVDTT